jgi:hypothetical protein
VQPGVAAAVVGVMVCAENIFDLLAGDAFDLRHDAIEIRLVLVIDHDYPFARHVDGDVAAVSLNNE